MLDYTGFPGIADLKQEVPSLLKTMVYLICKYTGHKLYWWDWEVWKERQASLLQFWDEYRVIKANHDLDHPIIKNKMYYQASSKYAD